MSVLYRSITRDLFGDEDVISVSPLARWLLLACFIEADREGRLAWRPKTLRLRYLPGDDCDIDKVAGELVDAGLVVTYCHGDLIYAWIPRFKMYQNINNKEKASQLPSPPSYKGGDDEF